MDDVVESALRYACSFSPKHQPTICYTTSAPPFRFAIPTRSTPLVIPSQDKEMIDCKLSRVVS